MTSTPSTYKALTCCVCYNHRELFECNQAKCRCLCCTHCISKMRIPKCPYCRTIIQDIQYESEDEEEIEILIDIEPENLFSLFSQNPYAYLFNID